MYNVNKGDNKEPWEPCQWLLEESHRSASAPTIQTLGGYWSKPQTIPTGREVKNWQCSVEVRKRNKLEIQFLILKSFGQFDAHKEAWNPCSIFSTETVIHILVACLTALLAPVKFHFGKMLVNHRRAHQHLPSVAEFDFARGAASNT